MKGQDSRDMQKIIRAAAKGDERAFEMLMREVETPVYRLALSMVKQREDAEDVTQETLVKLWRTLPSYRFDCPILAYTLQIARNTALDLLRRRRATAQNTVPLERVDEQGETVTIDVADPDESVRPDRAYERRERVQAVRRAIDELPVEYKEILVLKDMNGCSYEEIGHILHLEEGTVKSRLFRARKKLAEILKTRNIF